MKLNISLNEITCEGVAYLKNALSKTRIRDLNISRNPIKNIGVRYLGELLSIGGLFL